MLNENKKRKVLDIYTLRIINGRSANQVAKEFGTSKRAVLRACTYAKKILGLSDQDASDILFFYQTERNNLSEKRNEYLDKPTTYLAFTRLIIEIEDKMSEILKLKFGIKIENHNSNYIQIYKPEPYSQDDIVKMTANHTTTQDNYAKD